MDYAAEAETQQHQLFLLQQQQDQQQQYDPSQVQPLSYDQTAQAYYPYYPNAHHQYGPQPYPYYQPDYSNPSTVQNAYQQQHPPAENLQPPGISAPPEAAPPSAGAAQQNTYYPPEHGAYQVPHVLNPAAAAAVAALSELQHNMDAAERAERAMAAGMHERHHWPPRNGGYPPMSGPPPPFHHVGHSRPPVARPPYRGGGRPYRGGGRNNYGLHPYKSDSFRGRGRMARGGGRRFHPSGSAAPHHEPGAEPSTGAASEEVPIAQRPVPAATSRQMPQVSWCELCMVDCNSLEILEQHLNGKRHKKNVQRLQEFEKHKKMMAGLQQKSGVPLQQEQTQPQQEQTETHPQQQEARPHEIESQQQQSEPQPQPHPQQQTETQPEQQEQQAQSQRQESQPQLQSESESLPEKEVQSGAEEQESKQISAAPETSPHPTNEETAKMETEGKQQNQPGEQPIAEVSTAPTRRPMRGRGHWDDRRRVPKRGRMMRFVRGAKRMRMSERMMDEQFPREAKEPKEEPKFCSLCNVTCDTQAVFECHLAGKKHNSRVKRTQGSFGAYGLHSNYASHTQPAGYVPRGYHQPIIYSHPGQEITRQQPVVESESITEATSDSHGEKKSEPFQRQVIVGSGSQEAHTIQPEGQSSQHSSNVEPIGRFSVSEPKITEARPLDFGAPPVENVVLPGLETKAAEIVLNSEG
ncbi:mediator of RNA polymerase II transcription subunit 15-like [Aristolochia californica]|uniref:mediator of RNA polymerase II transcription subunit 15-like n=1 Tax=Aristolochia californica TaxID=171875 RepID=UPI0035D83C6C